MKPFDYAVPRSVDEAVRAASAPNTRFIAGGTNLIDLMKIEVETPAHLVDLNPLAESDSTLRSVGDAPGGGLRIGALTPMSDVAWDPRVKERYPVLSQALLLGASGQLRNMASMDSMQSGHCSTCSRMEAASRSGSATPSSRPTSNAR